jgi:hypothetical protein
MEADNNKGQFFLKKPWFIAMPGHNDDVFIIHLNNPATFFTILIQYVLFLPDCMEHIRADLFFRKYELQRYRVAPGSNLLAGVRW